MNESDLLVQKIINYIKTYFATVGISIATVASYVIHKSLIWATVHGFCSWGYLLYYIIKYKPL